jgi:hypothetical protein
MRTTIDLPPDLMHAAKVKAARHGETLKDLFTRAITHEVRGVSSGRSPGRLTFPLIGRDEGPKVEVTNADIDAAFDAEDVERYRR